MPLASRGSSSIDCRRFLINSFYDSLGNLMGRHYDRARWLWVLAALPPALFVLFFLVLTVLADPQHDDFCFSHRFVEQGLISIRGFYGELGGRIVPYGLIDVPAAISQATGISLLSAYSLTMY